MIFSDFLSIQSWMNDMLHGDGDKISHWGMGAVLSTRQLQTVALQGCSSPKRMPSTGQANINMVGNRAVFLWSSVPGDSISLGKIHSVQQSLAWDSLFPEASHSSGNWHPALWAAQATSRPPPESPSRSMGTGKHSSEIWVPVNEQAPLVCYLTNAIMFSWDNFGN